MDHLVWHEDLTVEGPPELALNETVVQTYQQC
jgi:hypothetical protein